MTVKQLKEIASRVLGEVEGTKVEVTNPRRRGSEVGGCYYGSTFFNGPQVSGNCPEYQMTKARGSVVCLVRYGRDLFRGWVMEKDTLDRMIQERLTYFLGWHHFAHIDIGQGVVFVTLGNRGEFLTALSRSLPYIPVGNGDSLPRKYKPCGGSDAEWSTAWGR